MSCNGAVGMPPDPKLAVRNLTPVWNPPVAPMAEGPLTNIATPDSLSARNLQTRSSGKKVQITHMARLGGHEGTIGPLFHGTGAVSGSRPSWLPFARHQIYLRVHALGAWMQAWDDEAWLQWTS